MPSPESFGGRPNKFVPKDEGLNPEEALIEKEETAAADEEAEAMQMSGKGGEGVSAIEAILAGLKDRLKKAGPQLTEAEVEARRMAQSEEEDERKAA